RHVLLVGTVKRLADRAADKRAKQHARTGRPEPARAAADRGACKAARDCTAKRADILLGTRARLACGKREGHCANCKNLESFHFLRSCFLGSIRLPSCTG